MRGTLAAEPALRGLALKTRLGEPCHPGGQAAGRAGRRDLEPRRQRAAVGEGDLRFVAADTNAPYVLNYQSADGNKAAYYWLRWVSPTGERGPWGEQSRATIAA